MDIRAAAVERVLARDPRGSMEETLVQVMTETRSSVAGLFLGRGDVSLLGGVSVDQTCLDRVRTTWQADAGRLKEWRPTWQGTWCVWPCESNRGCLLVYLAGPTLKLPEVREAITAVAELLDMLLGIEQGVTEAPGGGEAAQAAVDLYLKATSPEEVERRQLKVVLNDCEWNIARAARVLGITRITVYNRMQRLGIERLRVRRSGPRPSGAGA